MRTELSHCGMTKSSLQMVASQTILPTTRPITRRWCGLERRSLDVDVHRVHKSQVARLFFVTTSQQEIWGVRFFRTSIAQHGLRHSVGDDETWKQ